MMSKTSAQFQSEAKLAKPNRTARAERSVRIAPKDKAFLRMLQRGKAKIRERRAVARRAWYFK